MTQSPGFFRDTPQMDPLSHVLDLLTVENVVSRRFEAGGTWALSFPGSST